jgi:hypothetical protein
MLITCRQYLIFSSSNWTHKILLIDHNCISLSGHAKTYIRPTISIRSDLLSDLNFPKPISGLPYQLDQISSLILIFNIIFTESTSSQLLSTLSNRLSFYFSILQPAYGFIELSIRLNYLVNGWLHPSLNLQCLLDFLLFMQMRPPAGYRFCIVK